MKAKITMLNGAERTINRVNIEDPTEDTAGTFRGIIDGQSATLCRYPGGNWILDDGRAIFVCRSIEWGEEL